MSKKGKHSAKTVKLADFDFSSLLLYASEEQKEIFRNALEEPSISGLLLNEKTYSKEKLEKAFPFLKKEESDSLLYRFYKEENRLGKSVEHFGGAFYILDPSSAVISYYLEKHLPKDFVSFDMCGAPGGKSIALSFRRRDGLYLCNDISYERAIEIKKNADRLALTNLLSLSIDPQRVNLSSCFDLIILDAPCSGSGMIRKEPKMKADWSKEKVERLLPLQHDLLEKAYSLLKRDGILAYSTCSFSVEEDENQIATFLSSHPDMEVISEEVSPDIIPGRDSLGYHLIPGLTQGEGIYFCFLKKTGGERRELTPLSLPSFDKENSLFTYKKNEYVVSRMEQELKDLPFLSPGLTVHDNSQYAKCPYDHAYSKVAVLPLVSLTREQAIFYAGGNELRIEGVHDGLVILTYEGLRLGFGKSSQGRIKNYLPKGLRASLN